MAALVRKYSTNDSGFTLIELLVVVLILGILVAIAVPSFATQVQNSADTAASANIRSAVSDILASYTANNNTKPASGTYAGTQWDSSANTLESTVNGRVCTAFFNPGGAPFTNGDISCANTP